MTRFPKGKFTGRYSLDYVEDQPPPTGNRLVRFLKRFLGGLGNPEVYLYTPHPENPLTFHAADGRAFVFNQPFLFDGATTPRCLWWVDGLAPNDWTKAAIGHDWFFQTHHDGYDVVDFAEANQRLGEMVVTLGISSGKARLIYLACTVVGKSLWNYHYTASGEPDYAQPVTTGSKA